MFFNDFDLDRGPFKRFLQRVSQMNLNILLQKLFFAMPFLLMIASFE